MSDYKYETHVKPQFGLIAKKVSEGATEREIYTALGICKETWITYKKEHSDLLDLLNNVRAEALENVKCALYRSAIGTTLTDTKVYEKTNEDGETVETREVVSRQQPPNPQSIAMYLRNYDESWKDKAKIEYDFKDKELGMREKLERLKREADDWLSSTDPAVVEEI